MLQLYRIVSFALEWEKKEHSAAMSFILDCEPSGLISICTLYFNYQESNSSQIVKHSTIFELSVVWFWKTNEVFMLFWKMKWHKWTAMLSAFCSILSSVYLRLECREYTLMKCSILATTLQWSWQNTWSEHMPRPFSEMDMLYWTSTVSLCDWFLPTDFSLWLLKHIQRDSMKHFQVNWIR